MILEVKDLHVGYGKIRALRGCSLRIADNTATAVIGANGAGKTTLLRAVSNMLPRERGEVLFASRETQGTPTHQLTRSGMLHVPEGRGTLGRMSVRENLRLAYDIKPAPTSFEDALEKVFAIFPRIRERIGQLAGTLSGGEQQMLSLARAVVNPPRLLLVDEPSLGLSPLMAAEAFRALKQLRDDGIAILLVEQNIRRALQFADYGYVLRHGRFVMDGPSSELRDQQNMLDHYLGATATPG